MSEIGTFIRGNGLQKKDFTPTGIGCIHYGQIYTYYGTWADKTLTYCSPNLAAKLKVAHKGDIIIATTSENVEDVCKAVAWLGDNDIVISGDAYIFSHNQNPKYISYLFQTHDFFNFKQKNQTGTKVSVSSTNSRHWLTTSLKDFRQRLPLYRSNTSITGINYLRLII